MSIAGKNLGPQTELFQKCVLQMNLICISSPSSTSDRNQPQYNLSVASLSCPAQLWIQVTIREYGRWDSYLIIVTSSRSHSIVSHEFCSVQVAEKPFQFTDTLCVSTLYVSSFGGTIDFYIKIRAQWSLWISLIPMGVLYFTVLDSENPGVLFTQMRLGFFW